MSMPTVSKYTQKNWAIDAALFISAVVASLSGIYFLYFPSGGYQGGRNPLFNVQVFFTRQTWNLLHTWGGVAMLVVAMVHLVIHWPWVGSMARRTWNELNGKCGCMNARSRGNLVLNLVVVISFLLTGASGVYFLFAPGGRAAIDPMFLFSRTTWDLIHTWVGVVFIAAAIVHFVIHWRWVAKVTAKMLAMLMHSPANRQPVPVKSS